MHLVTDRELKTALISPENKMSKPDYLTMCANLDSHSFHITFLLP